MRAIKKTFIGARLENIRVDLFGKFGLPVPLYTQKKDLLLLFENEDDRENYLNTLILIKTDMVAFDPDKKKTSIQDTIAFINLIMAALERH